MDFDFAVVSLIFVLLFLTKILSSYALFGLGIAALVLSTSQFVYGYLDSPRDYAAILSAAALFLTSSLFWVNVVSLFVGGNYILFPVADAVILANIAIIGYIWLGSEGFRRVLYLIQLRRFLSEDEEEKTVKVPTAAEAN